MGEFCNIFYLVGFYKIHCFIELVNIMIDLFHPWEFVLQEIKEKGWSQKHFAFLCSKKISEINELIKGKRNITIQRDLILHYVLWTPEKYRIQKQLDYDYEIAKKEFDHNKITKERDVENLIWDNEKIFHNF